MYPRKFEDIILAFHRLPGVGMKSAEKYAYALLDWDEQDRREFLKALDGIDEVRTCRICGNLSETETCSICSDPDRNKNQICVVQNPKDISVIESLDEFAGVYHVLGGTINTGKGILPDDLNIASLSDRITPETEEIILALDPTVEGETTALYLEKLLKDRVKVTHLVQGIPMGSKLNYADPRTLAKAFKGRQ